MQGRGLSLNPELRFEEPVTKPDECRPLKIAEGSQDDPSLLYNVSKGLLGLLD